jgi:hypothetical protein
MPARRSPQATERVDGVNPGADCSQSCLQSKRGGLPYPPISSLLDLIAASAARIRAAKGDLSSPSPSHVVVLPHAATIAAYEPASRLIHPLCNPYATAVAPVAGYSDNIESASTKQRASAMMARVISEGRLFSLKPFDWAVLLVGMTLCGALTSLF